MILRNDHGGTNMSDGTRPIGYWLKHLDSLLETAFDRVLAAHAVDRRQWQTLSLLDAAPRTEGDLAEALLPFLGSDTQPLGEAIGALEGRGWIAGDDDRRYAVTASGRTALATLAHDVGSLRTLLTEGVTEEEYQTTIDVLTRMARNLEPAMSDDRTQTTAEP